MAPHPPFPLGPLVGREVELDRIRSATERLVTVKGPGGMGKTRVAIAAAPEAFWCDLTYARTEDDVRRALEDVPEPEGAWIVLDNFESVADVGKPVALELLHAGHRLLVSSREALGIPGERVIELPPLGVGDEAITLFLQHAGRHDPPLVLTPKNEGAIRALVAAIDGIPLAIELAARRACTLGPDEVLARLEKKGIGILSRPGPDRHASLERTIDETFRALPDDEQRVFLDVSVFRNGFTLEAAATILEGDVTNLLQSLRDKSLLWLDAPGGRFRMHEVIRDFAIERAVERDTLLDRHAAFFIGWIDRVRTPAGVIPNREQRERVLADVENVRAAAEHALAKGDLEGCVRALAGVAPTVRIYGESHWWTALRNATRGATTTTKTKSLPADLEARIELVETLMLSLRGRREDAEARAARLAESAADPDARLAAAILHVQHLLERGEIDARTAPTENAHPALVAEWALVSLQTRLPDRDALERATAEAEKLGDATLLAATARVRALLELAKGNVPAARVALERERSIAEEAELRPVLAQNVLRFGCCDQLEGNLEAASERFGEAIEKMSALELTNRLPRAHALLGLLSIERGDPERARSLFADADADADAHAHAHAHAHGRLATLGRALADHLEGRGPMPELPAPNPALWASPLADLDRALRVTVRRTFANGPPLRVEVDQTASWFSTGKQKVVDLSERDSLRHVLRSLLDARGASVEAALLIAAGWPGERIREDAARNRLRVCIATLRKLGLEGAIETEGTTYRLRAVVVRR